MKLTDTYKSLLERLDSLLDEEQFGSDERLTSEVALKLLGLLLPELNAMQLEAMRVAKSYWDGQASQEQLHAVARSLADRFKETQGVAERHRAYVLDRLAFAASNANTAFDITAADFLVGMACDLDMDPGLVSDIFMEELKQPAPRSD